MPSSNSNLFMIDIEGIELSAMEREIIKHPHVGSVILFTRNFTSPQQLEQLIREIRDIDPNIFVATDHEGGFVQRFLRQGFRSLPASRVYGDVYDLNPEVGIQLAKQYGEVMAKDLLACGVDVSLAPVLDLHGQSRVIAHLDRAFHHEPEAIIALASAFIEGMHAAGMPAVAKHFPGHGSVSADSHSTMPISFASMDELKSKDLKPFIELIKRGLLNAIMPAHITYKEIDANKPAGFSTIWLSMTGADIGNLMTRTEEALKAGCDMLIVCHQPRQVLLELLQKITLSQTSASAARITHFKNQMLRFVHPEQNQLKPYLSTIAQEKDSAVVSKNQQFNTSETI